MRSGFACLVAALLACVGGTPALADALVLHSGGEIRGRWVNRQEQPLQAYVIETDAGGRLTVSAGQVREAIVEDGAPAQYAAVAASFPDTVAGQWALAEWCRQRGLKSQREKHLRRILDLDPDHVGARHGLGYSQFRGRWTTREEVYRRRGFALDDGRWQLPQEIELRKAAREVERQENEWLARLRTCRAQLLSEKALPAYRELSAIRDPRAVRPLATLLRTERTLPLKLLYIEVLAQIASPEAIQTLFEVTLSDPDGESFHACLEKIVKLKPPHIAGQYAKFLKDANNVRVNRAAYALGQLEDQTVLSPLIDALTTTHLVRTPSRSPDTYSLTFMKPAGAAGLPGFSPPGTTFGAGDQSRVIPCTVANQEVLDALVRLSGGANFGFDKKAWASWLAAENRRSIPEINARRDGS